MSTPVAPAVPTPVRSDSLPAPCSPSQLDTLPADLDVESKQDACLNFDDN